GVDPDPREIKPNRACNSRANPTSNGCPGESRISGTVAAAVNRRVGDDARAGGCALPVCFAATCGAAATTPIPPPPHKAHNPGQSSRHHHSCQCTRPPVSDVRHHSKASTARASNRCKPNRGLTVDHSGERQITYGPPSRAEPPNFDQAGYPTTGRVEALRGNTSEHLPIATAPATFNA